MITPGQSSDNTRAEIYGFLHPVPKCGGTIIPHVMESAIILMKLLFDGREFLLVQGFFMFFYQGQVCFSKFKSRHRSMDIVGKTPTSSTNNP